MVVHHTLNIYASQIAKRTKILIHLQYGERRRETDRQREKYLCERCANIVIRMGEGEIMVQIQIFYDCVFSEILEFMWALKLH